MKEWSRGFDYSWLRELDARDKAAYSLWRYAAQREEELKMIEFCRRAFEESQSRGDVDAWMQHAKESRLFDTTQR